MEKVGKKICWITPDYFLIVDAPKVPHLAKEFDISWILVNSFNTNRTSDGLLWNDFKPEEFALSYRYRDPRILSQYLPLLLKIRKLKPDLIYISFHGFPYFLPLFLMFFNSRKIVWGVHNVKTLRGDNITWLMDAYQNFVFRRIKNIHVFSEYQLNAIKKLFPDKNHFFIPLTLEDYGVSELKPPEKLIRFLFFGYIKDYKGLDLLINAFRELRKSGFENIELMIVGECNRWDLYDSLIEGDSAIRIRIESIPNNEIPDAVCACHYLVLPYRECTQSGVLNIAFQYNKPVIVPDLDAFKGAIIDGYTGFFFRNGSKESLTIVMKNIILNHNEIYHKVKKNIKDYVDKEFSIDRIVERYKELLQECLSLEDPPHN